MEAHPLFSPPASVTPPSAEAITPRAPVRPRASPVARRLAQQRGLSLEGLAGSGPAGAILLASENAVKVSLEAVQALGGAGYTKEWPVERLVRDAKLYDIGAGTNEIRRFLIGRELLGG